MVGFAKFLLLLQLAAVGAVAGAFVAFFGLILVAQLFGASTMEGGLAMGAVGFMPFGAIGGAGVAVWLCWKFRYKLSDRGALASGFGLIALVGLAIGGWFLIEELSDGNPYDQGKEPWVHIEWRLPEELDSNEIRRIFRHTMRSPHMDWTLTTQWDVPDMRYEAGHTLLRLRGELRWRLDGRIFQLWRAPAHNDRITINLNLGHDPQPMDDYGPWVEVDEHPGQAWRVKVTASR